MVHNITLYQFEDCPFCAKVRAKLEELNLEYEKVNVSRDREDETRVVLREKSNVSTVPVIDIDGEFIGDSDPIIQKLESMG
ncbi:glutaredoxin [Candidatus Woesearchaeota archaeon]|jgi:glutaredoxin|nr:glutaredoxin [Candidatus Woesearchaeota archaeon]|tara:strand:+ start:118 stop:360 length:243 start_codon:yes stop_codon:yes gene_type:complete